MIQLTRLAVRSPRTLLAAWLAVVAALAVVGAPLEKRLQPTRLIVPGTKAATWDDLRRGHFGDDTVVVLYGPPAALDREGAAIVADLARSTGAPMISPWSGSAGVRAHLRVSPQVGVVILDQSGGREVVPDARIAALQREVRGLVRPPLTGIVTGPAAISEAVTEDAIGAANKAQRLAIPLLLAVLLLVFRSPVAAIVPLMVASATVGAGRGVLMLLEHVLHLDSTAAVLLEMIGLALGVDYSLLIVTRYREGLAAGDDPPRAAVLAAHTAGRTAAFAGVTLIAILGVTLAVAPGGILVSATAGALVGTVIAVSGALVATPAVLILLGRRVPPLAADRPGILSRIVEMSLARPRRAALLAGAPLLAVALAALGLNTIPPDPRTLPASSLGGREFAATRLAEMGAGFDLVIRSAPGPVTDPAVLRAAGRLEHGLRSVPTVVGVIGPASLSHPIRVAILHRSGPAALTSGFSVLAGLDSQATVHRAAARYIVDLGQGGTTSRIVVTTVLDPADSRAPRVLAAVQALAHRFTSATGRPVAVGGQAAELVQFDHVTKQRLPLIVTGIVLATFLVLVPVLRSLLLPAIVVGLNMLTVATTFGVLTLLFVGKHPVLGRAGALDVISVSMAFAIVFALSIDYQVFLLARMREGFVLKQDPVAAIRYGVQRTARIVTGAAMIMLGVFVAFGTADVSNVQQFGIGLSVAILVDATLVRLVLLPAVLSLAGLRTWWLPDPLERRLPELDVEGVGYVRTREEVLTRAAELW